MAKRPDGMSRSDFKAQQQRRTDEIAKSTVILMIDDFRSMRKATEVARTNRDGIAMLERYRGIAVKELWLDHYMSAGDGTIVPVVEHLEAAARNGNPFLIGTVFCHSSDRAAAFSTAKRLISCGYHANTAVLSNV